MRKPNLTAALAESNPVVAAILEYARCGLHVFPCHNPLPDGSCSCGKPKCRTAANVGKHPRTKNGFKDATTDPNTIRLWARRWPHANWAIRTGAVSGIIALDVDPRHGGGASLTELVQKYGPLPQTVTAKTGGGGRHFIFKHPGKHRTINNSQGAIGAGIDLRGDGGYIMAAPSLHVSGSRYQWDIDLDHPLACLPDWLLTHFTQRRRDAESQTRKQSVCLCKVCDSSESTNGQAETVKTIPTRTCATVDEAIQRTLPDVEGQRNRKLFDFARALKSVPGFERADESKLTNVVKRWHTAALSKISTKEFAITYAEFLYAWKRVKSAAGDGQAEQWMKLAQTAEWHSVAQKYESDVLRRLIGWCREAQRAVGDGPFHASFRLVGAILKVSHSEAGHLLQLLVDEKVLLLVRRHPRETRLASEYRFISDDCDDPAPDTPLVIDFADDPRDPPRWLREQLARARESA